MRISDWSSDVCSSDLLKHQDNWRKELYDAGLFDPESAAKLLINPEQLLSLICKKHAGSLWLLGDKNTVQRYAFLQTLDNPMQSAKLRARSEEHTSELQSLMRISYAVFCLKNKKLNTKTH